MAFNDIISQIYGQRNPRWFQNLPPQGGGQYPYQGGPYQPQPPVGGAPPPMQPQPMPPGMPPNAVQPPPSNMIGAPGGGPPPGAPPNYPGQDPGYGPMKPQPTQQGFSPMGPKPPPQGMTSQGNMPMGSRTAPGGPMQGLNDPMAYQQMLASQGGNMANMMNMDPRMAAQLLNMGMGSMSPNPPSSGQGRPSQGGRGGAGDREEFIHRRPFQGGQGR